MKANYILTTLSPTMFGASASIFMKTITEDEARDRITDDTQIVSTRESHANMAQILFGTRRVIRIAELGPDRCAILIHYRGPPVGDDGHKPKGGTITYYLFETEEYDEG